MEAQLYGASLSYPSLAARLMLEHKGIEYEWVRLMPGVHAVKVRLAGFRGGTIPALKLDGRRVVGSRRISRVLDEVTPEPALFPDDPVLRRAVEEAEEWGDSFLQPIPRRLLRWTIRHRPDMRITIARSLHARRPERAARYMGPIGFFLARREDARSTDQIRADWEALPAHLEHVEQLIAEGVIGGPKPNAADFQIAPILRAMLEFEDYAPLVSGGAMEQLARRIMPEYRYRFPSLMHLVPAA